MIISIIFKLGNWLMPIIVIAKINPSKTARLLTSNPQAIIKAINAWDPRWEHKKHMNIDNVRDSPNKIDAETKLFEFSVKWGRQ